MAGEGVVMETAQVPNTSERISNSQDVSSNSNDDESGVTLGLEVVESGETEEAKPNFRLSILPEQEFTNLGDGEVVDLMLIEPQSGDYPLSLISWYSEPADTEVYRSCCNKVGFDCDLRNEVIAQSPFSYGEESDRSDEKENKTPPPPPSLHQVKVDEKAKCLKMKLDSRDKDNRSRRLDRKCDSVNGKSIERSRSVGAATGSIRNVSKEERDPSTLECPRCSRKTRSGTTTPATTTRVPKRQILKSALTSRKPIKSILKSDFRGGSSGSEKQSSMDSLGSNHTSGMTASDIGPKLHTKFSTELNGKQWTDSDFVGLKRIERYATLRPRRLPLQKSPTSNPPSEVQENGRKSFENLTTQQRQNSTELMTKSLTQAKTDSEKEFQTPLQRSGSLRGRRANTAVVQPCATRTSVLRMLKMQAKKGLVPISSSNGTDKATFSCGHSDSGESSSTPQAQVHSAQTPSTSKHPVSNAKIFSKLSSSFTASSAQKRQRQDRGIQTEPILILKKLELNGSGISRSPTPMSPEDPSSETRPDKIDPAIELGLLRLELKKYKAKVIKYEHIYNAAELENVLLGNQLREVENESKETINFLQDEKLMLAESLAEAEAEKQVLLAKLEAQAKIKQKLEEKLNLGRSQVKEAKEDVASYTNVLESESLKAKTLQDEVALLRKRFEKLNEEQDTTVGPDELSVNAVADI